MNIKASEKTKIFIKIQYFMKLLINPNDIFGFNDVTQNRYLTYTVSNQTWVADTVVIGNHQDLLNSATTDKAKTIYQHYIAIIESSEK